jgi:hypothetical protein
VTSSGRSAATTPILQDSPIEDWAATVRTIPMRVTAMPAVCSHVVSRALMLGSPATAAIGAAKPTRMATPKPIFAHHCGVFGWA